MGNKSMERRGAHGQKAVTGPVPERDLTKVLSSLAGWKERVRALLKARGLNMRSASLRAGLGETFFRDMLERGRTPKFENARRIADVLNVPVSAIWCDYDPPLADAMPDGDAGTEPSAGIGVGTSTRSGATLLLRLAFLVNQHFKQLGVEPSPEKWAELAEMLQEIRRNEKT